MRYPVKCRRPEITSDSLDFTFSKGFCSSAFSDAAELFAEDGAVGVTTVALATEPRSLRFLDGLLSNTGYGFICCIQYKGVHLKSSSERARSAPGNSNSSLMFAMRQRNSGL